MKRSRQEKTDKNQRKQGHAHELKLGNDPVSQPSELNAATVLGRFASHRRSAAALHMQRTHGNAHVQRMLTTAHPPIQRQAQWQREMEAEGTVINLPEPFNWDFAAPMQVNQLEAWNEGVTFQDLRFARHLGEPFINNHAIPNMHRIQNVFRGDWTNFQGHWNQIKSLAASLDIQGIPAPQGQPAAQAGQPRTTDTGTDATRPRGNNTPTVGSLFQENPTSAGAQLAMTSTLDPQRLPQTLRDRYHALMLAAHTKSNATRSQANNVDTALSGVRQAAMAVDIGQLRVDSAQQSEQSSHLSAEQQQVTAERDRIGVALGVIKESASMAFAVSANKPDVATASGINLTNSLILEQYNERLRRIDAQMRVIAERVAAIGTQIALIEFNRTLEGVRTARNAYNNAILELSTKVADEADAYRQFADFIEQNGQAMGLSAQDVRTATSAAAALPLIEDTIRQYQQVIDAMQFPRYTRESGIGITMAPTNLGAFVLRVAQFKGYKQVLERGKVEWEGKRSTVRAGIGMPAAPVTN